MLATVEKLDPATGVWTRKADLPQAAYPYPTPTLPLTLTLTLTLTLALTLTLTLILTQRSTCHRPPTAWGWASSAVPRRTEAGASCSPSGATRRVRPATPVHHPRAQRSRPCVYTPVHQGLHPTCTPGEAATLSTRPAAALRTMPAHEPTLPARPACRPAPHPHRRLHRRRLRLRHEDGRVDLRRAAARPALRALGAVVLEYGLGLGAVG